MTVEPKLRVRTHPCPTCGRPVATNRLIRQVYCSRGCRAAADVERRRRARLAGTKRPC